MDASLRDLCSVLDGRLRLGCPPPRDGELAVAGRIVTDSREVQYGDVFWALTGQQRDGADFADEAMQRGALGVVVANRRIEPWAGAFVLEVDDTRLALWQLADWNRRRFDGLVVAVSGSVGKSATQQMIDAVLRTQCAGASPPGDDSDVGVPLSVLTLKPHHEYAVLRLKAGTPGEMDAAVRLAAPQIGVISRIGGDAPLGACEDPASKAAIQGALLAVLGADDQAVLCGDDPALRRVATTCRAPVLWYGRHGDCDVSATEVHCAGGLLRFRVQQQAFAVPVWGRHHLDATLAAVGVGLIYGCSLAEAADALAGFRPASMHCEVTEVLGAAIINDASNASPEAARAALQLLAEYPTVGQRIALVGDLGDLGPCAATLHYELGQQIVITAGADRLFACGQYASQIAAGAAQSGMANCRVTQLADSAECADAVRDVLAAGDVLLIKGPRALGLHRVIESLASQGVAQAA